MTECGPQRKIETLKNLCQTTVNDLCDKMRATILRIEAFCRLFAVVSRESVVIDLPGAGKPGWRRSTDFGLHAL
jgi:hypothetical protein